MDRVFELKAGWLQKLLSGPLHQAAFLDDKKACVLVSWNLIACNAYISNIYAIFSDTRDCWKLLSSFNISIFKILVTDQAKKL